MKKFFIGTCMALAITLSMSCSNENTAESGTHTHDDGSVHTDHDTTKPVQEEFKVTDTIKSDTSHSHDDGKPHAH